MGLQRVIEGELLDAADPAQVRVAGAMLAELQDALAAYPDADRLLVLADAWPSLTDRVTDWLNHDAGHLPTTARDALREMLDGAPADQSPRQLVHFDFRSANILCAGGEIVASIDFEEAQHEYRLVELPAQQSCSAPSGPTSWA